MTLPTYLQDLGHDIYAVDTGFEREQFDAAYLVLSAGRAAFIDTGHNAGVPRLLGALDALGIPRTSVDWVIPTHVHLDHAGGAGLLMENLPTARAMIHPRGARHLIDPSALVAGAQGVYGEAVVTATYGDIRPIPAERVSESSDGMDLVIGERTLHFIDTPGHARHHHCIWDERSRGWFTGDTFGISYPEFQGSLGRFIFPSSTPVQFEPAALRQSILRMLDKQPDCIFPTHFSKLAPVEPLVEQLFAQLDEIESGALRIGRDPKVAPADRLAALTELVGQSLFNAAKKQGVPLPDEALRASLALDAGLNAAGIAVWLDKTLKAAA